MKSLLDLSMYFNRRPEVRDLVTGILTMLCFAPILVPGFLNVALPFESWFRPWLNELISEHLFIFWVIQVILAMVWLIYYFLFIQDADQTSPTP